MQKKLGSSTFLAESADSDSDSKGRIIKSVAVRTRTYMNQPAKLEMREDNIANQLTTVQKDSLVLDAFGTMIGTNTQPKSTTETSTKATSQLTLEGSKLNQSQVLICSVVDFLAKASALLERGKGLKTLEGRSFMRFAESLNITDLDYFSLRTSKDYSTTIMGERLEPSLNPLTNWGMMLNGKCLTARISAYHRTGKGCSLSDILEETPRKKYFLSEKSMKSLLEHSERHQKLGHGFKHSIVTIGKEEEREL